MDAILNRETVTGVTISDAQDLFGKAKNASALPTATIWKNGVATATAITVTKPEATTGIYICTFTLSSPDWSVYDTYSILFTALQNDGETDHPAQMFVREGIVKPEHHFSLYVEPTEGTVKAEVEGMATALELDALEDKVDAAIAAIAALDTKFDTQPVIVSGIGSGSVAVNHNYGGADELRVLLDGVPFDNAQIQAYLTSDYDAHNLETQYIKGRSKTNVEGRWEWPIMLDPGNYTLVFFKQGFFVPQPFEITVT